MFRQRMRIPRFRPRDHVEQQRQIAHGARHRSVGGNLVEEKVAHGIARYPPETRSEAVDVAEGGRIAQRTHRVGAVRERHQARRQRGRRAAARPAGGLRQIVGIARHAADGIEAVRSQAEFGRVGLADQDRAGGPDARGKQFVLVGYMIAEDRRAVRGANARGLDQILDGEGQAVQRPLVGCCVSRSRLRQQIIAWAKRDDRVDGGIDAVDAVEERRHHLDAGNLAGRYGPREGFGVEGRDVGHAGRCGADMPPRQTPTCSRRSRCACRARSPRASRWSGTGRRP